MGIFDFLKKKQEERKKITYEEISHWIYEKNQEIDTNNQLIINLIKENINSLKQGLEESIEKLKNISLENKKEQDKIKLVVEENLKKYLNNLIFLIKSLEKLSYFSYEQAIVEIDSILNDFKKRSLMHYEKATILIGDELGITKEKISDFSKNLNKIIQDNQTIIKNNKNIQSINEELNTINSTNTMIDECDKKIIILKENIKLKENEIKDYLEIIMDLKKSNEYKKELEEKANIYQLKIEYENKINELKSLIDFKKLSSLNHSDNKKMKLIHELKENFKENYQENRLIGILKESSLCTQEMEKIIQEISNHTTLINSKESTFPDKLAKEISSKEEKITSLRKEIESLNEDISKEERIKQKFNESKLVFIGKIKAILMSMNIELN